MIEIVSTRFRKKEYTIHFPGSPIKWTKSIDGERLTGVFSLLRTLNVQISLSIKQGTVGFYNFLGNKKEEKEKRQTNINSMVRTYFGVETIDCQRKPFSIILSNIKTSSQSNYGLIIDVLVMNNYKVLKKHSSDHYNS